MEITWYGERKVIVALDCEFEFTDEAHDAVVQAEWATNVLAQPPVTYMNGRNSHEVAGEVLEKAEDQLLEFQLFH